MGNVKSNVAARFAFFPPDPPTYEFIKNEDGRLVLQGVPADKNMDVHLLDTKGGNKIVATFRKHLAARLTLLYSHGNAADLGQMHELFNELRSHLRPSEVNTYHDVEAVYNYLKNEYGEEDLIVYGQSVGSGTDSPFSLSFKETRWRRSSQRHPFRPSGLISGQDDVLLRYLQGKFHRNTSLCHFVFDWNLKGLSDRYLQNIDKIRHVNCPVLVIHGTEDDIVDFSHGKRLRELANEKYDPLWVEGGGHCNLEMFPEYIRHLRKFIKAMEELSITKPAKELTSTPKHCRD
ncbi:two-component response regulator ARR12-like isoform 1 [Hibiscus syriacus]|uniref:Two-component response regulator ARR12-like isoform 1 n=1 Tax=Hibiscus syriacus TaxID=106335 RepID=A0A6A3AC83_HIBSY|nr:two-component response regulator ARR12-like isoform 1 [Hibiscus syriacus]KAE8726503.1 two-component response regulator ARR12-like isoform 1 [Hibiscus syriacus]